MNPGDVVLVRMYVAGSGAPKLRPAPFLAELPGPSQTILLCGISTQPLPPLPDWDEPIDPKDADFAGSGLHKASVIRLSYLAAVEPSDIAGVIGRIDPARWDRLRTRLAGRVRP